jgi:hypothetical protein
MPGWIDGIRIRLYVLFLNRLYGEEWLHSVRQAHLATIRRFDEPAQG